MALCRQIPHKKSGAGFSILELLIAISIFSSLLLFSMESFLKAESAIREQDMVLKRIQLFQGLINMMGMPNSIRATIEQDSTTDLAKCVRGPWCDEALTEDLTLHLPPLYMGTSGINISGAISGPPGHPVLYNLYGDSCDTSVGTCDPDEFPISVHTQYQAVCPPMYEYFSVAAYWPLGTPIYPAGIAHVPGTTCIRAHYIRVLFVFEPTPGATSAVSFKPVQGSIMVSAVSIAFTR